MNIRISLMTIFLGFSNLQITAMNAGAGPNEAFNLEVALQEEQQAAEDALRRELDARLHRQRAQARREAAQARREVAQARNGGQLPFARNLFNDFVESNGQQR